MGWVVDATPRSPYLLEIDPLHTVQEAGWVLGGCGKSHPHRDSISGPPRP